MAGKGNSYGHPSVETLTRLSGVGVNVLGTDVNGTIVFLVDGAGYSVQSAKQGQAQAPSVAPITEPTAILVTQATPSGDILISMVSLTSPIYPGSTATLIIQTVPGANCSITVYYKSGASQAAGLGPQTADASGQVTWSWNVGSRTAKGIWKIVVQFELGGKTTKLEIPFEVQ